MRQKGKAFKWFGMFLVFMLVCGMVSRGIYAEEMPRIITAQIQTTQLNHKVEGEGVVEAMQEKPFTLPAGLPVANVCVRQGQKVEEGDVLLYLDQEGINNLYQEKQQELTLAKTRLSDYQAGVAKGERDHQINLNRANEDYNNTLASTDSNLSSARNAWESAKSSLANFPSLKEYKKKAREEDSQYQELQERAKSRDARKEDKQTFRDYKAQFESKTESQYQAEKQALKEEVAQREAEVSAADSEKNEKMSQVSRALEDARETEPVEGALGLELEQAIDLLEKQCEKYKAFLDSQGAILAGETAYVSKILVEAGGITGDGGALVLGTIGETLFFTGNITKEEKKYVNTNDTINISFGSGSYVSDIPVLAVGEQEDGSYKITAEIPSRGLAIGESGSFSLVKQTEKFSCCIPLDALHTEDYEKFVYYIEKQETILGTELVAKKRKVKVLDKDEEFAALEEGTFTEEELLIVNADKKYSVGSRVRMEE